jgi:hypothetical protein
MLCLIVRDQQVHYALYLGAYVLDLLIHYRTLVRFHVLQLV